MVRACVGVRLGGALATPYRYRNPEGGIPNHPAPLRMDGYDVIALFFGLWVVLHYTARVLRTLARERTRREIAAYIAEGSITPEQGERLFKAGGGGD